MKVWDELVADAVLGTERRPPTAPQSADRAVQSVLAAIDWTDAEGALLRAAAVVAIYRQAGRRAERDGEPLPAAAAADTRPRSGAAAGNRLAAMLDGHHRSLLPEWLRAVEERGLRVPEEHLPALLELARWQRELREVVVPVIGERGRWLATVNPDWAYAAAGAAQPERGWATAPRDARPLLLTRLRRSGPEAARALLERSWPTESPADRPKLVEALAEGLSMADEPFLEAALDDRRKEVRRAAAELLARLPESRLASRLAERLAFLVAVEGRRRPRLVVKLPDVDSEDVLRLGLATKGSRTAALQALLAAAPLSWWCRHTGRSPDELIGLAAASDHADALLAGWSLAARRQGDAVWADALLPIGHDELLAVLPPERREQHASSALRDRKLSVAQTLHALEACESPWSIELSRAAIAFLARTLATLTGSADAYPLRDAVPVIAGAMHVGATEDAAAALPPESAKPWAQRLGDSLVEILRQRRDMFAELRSG